MRVTDGNSPFEGRVDYCDNNVWGSICDDGWDNLDAEVVCREVGRQMNVTIYSMFLYKL